MEKNTKEDLLLIKNFNSLYAFNQVYLFGHLLIGFECLFFNIPEMVFLNLFSVLWFLYNGFRMKRTDISKYSKAEIRITVEIILHQVIAFIFVGSACGLQYVLLSCSCTVFTLYKNDKSKKQYFVKAFLLVAIFVLIEAYGVVYTPKYVIDEKITVLWKASIILYCFVVTAYFTLKNYDNIAVSMENFKSESIAKSENIQKLQKDVIISLANVIESRDGSTGEHTKRTTKYVNKIIKQLIKENKYVDILTDEYISNLRLAAPLHDIGKIKISDIILQKPDPLNDKEYNAIKKHTIYGGQIIKDTIKEIEDPEYVTIAYNVAMYHHEKFDGTGYPVGLKGDEIPLEARIMAVADVYDALITERCYKKAFTKEKAYEIIEDGKGTQFDPEIADAFLAAVAQKKEA